MALENMIVSTQLEKIHVLLNVLTCFWSYFEFLYLLFLYKLYCIKYIHVYIYLHSHFYFSWHKHLFFLLYRYIHTCYVCISVFINWLYISKPNEKWKEMLIWLFVVKFDCCVARLTEYKSFLKTSTAANGWV